MIDYPNSQTTNGGAESNGQHPARAVLLLSNLLDCQALTELFGRRAGVDVLEAVHDVEAGLASCRRLRPEVVVDPKVSAAAIERVADLASSQLVRQVIVLDDRVHESRLATVLAMPAVSYFTRQAGFEVLYSAVRRAAVDSDQMFGPSVVGRLVETSEGWQLNPTEGRPSVAALTSREREVMRLLVEGRTVRGCAEQLRLSVSTVDNHKVRLMKKLQIHKIAQLTQLAIRDGLITV